MAEESKKVAPQYQAVKVKIVGEPKAPPIYVNYVEVGHTSHEFAMRAGRVPISAPPSAIASGTIDISAEIELILPPTVIPGLIAALTAQLQAYHSDQQGTGNGEPGTRSG